MPPLRKSAGPRQTKLTSHKNRKGYPPDSERQHGMDGNQLEVVKEAFRDLFEEAVITQVDPQACVPFSKVRGLSSSGITRLKESFQSDGSDESGIPGVTSGGVFPTVVKLEGAFGNYPLEHMTECLVGKGFNVAEAKMEAEKKFKAQKTWYGIIDGNHRHAAITELASEYPEKWLGFSWTVMLIRPASLSLLRSFARSVNEKQKEEYIVVQTFYDTLRYLKEESQTMLAETGSPPSATQLAERVMQGQKWALSTIIQLARTAVRIPDKVLDEIGSVVNAEHPELAKRLNAELPPHRQARGTPDCRVFRNIITCSTLKQAKSFMNSTSIEDSINTIRRIAYFASNHHYKPVSFTIVEKQYKAAVLARKEAEKFEKYLQTHQWPQDMLTARRNLLKTSLFDDAVDSNSGNDKNVLPQLLDMHKSLFPDDAFVLAAQFKESHGAVVSSQTMDTIGAEDNPSGMTKNNTEPEGLNQVTCEAAEVPDENILPTCSSLDERAMDESMEQKEAEKTSPVRESQSQISARLGTEGESKNGQTLEDSLRIVNKAGIDCFPVSYTHLTLPTIA